MKTIKITLNISEELHSFISQIKSNIKFKTGKNISLESILHNYAILGIDYEQKSQKINSSEFNNEANDQNLNDNSGFTQNLDDNLKLINTNNAENSGFTQNFDTSLSENNSFTQNFGGFLNSFDQKQTNLLKKKQIRELKILKNELNERDEKLKALEKQLYSDFQDLYHRQNCILNEKENLLQKISEFEKQRYVIENQNKLIEKLNSEITFLNNEINQKELRFLNEKSEIISKFDNIKSYVSEIENQNHKQTNLIIEKIETCTKKDFMDYLLSFLPSIASILINLKTSSDIKISVAETKKLKDFFRNFYNQLSPIHKSQLKNSLGKNIEILLD